VSLKKLVQPPPHEPTRPGLRLAGSSSTLRSPAPLPDDRSSQKSLSSVTASEFAVPEGFLRRKRVVDLLLLVALAPCILPFLLIVPCLIRLESRGPVLYRQVRVGLRGTQFEMLKFRTMREETACPGARFTAANDARVTRVGRLLRKIHIDELPQFWNVLKGDMSVVGPRPEQPDFVEEFEKAIEFYSLRHLVRPGLTGWAQVNQGYVDSTASTRRKLEYDLYYIEAQSLWLDLRILARTIPTMAMGRGAR
jgi:exopolysaccharide biosynthesis polyprenyl glycosylphosphotransferase